MQDYCYKQKMNIRGKQEQNSRAHQQGEQHRMRSKANASKAIHPNSIESRFQEELLRKENRVPYPKSQIAQPQHGIYRLRNQPNNQPGSRKREQKSQEKDEYARLDDYQASILGLRLRMSKVSNDSSPSKRSKANSIYGAKVQKEQIKQQYKKLLEPLSNIEKSQEPNRNALQRQQVPENHSVPSKIKASQLHEIRDIPQQQQVPCPFCSVPLLPNEIFHIKQCDQGIQCGYCKERYPRDLITFHSNVCRKKSQISQLNRREQPRKQQPKRVQPQREQRRVNEFNDIRQCPYCKEDYVLGFLGDHLKFCKGANQDEDNQVRCERCGNYMIERRIQIHMKYCRGSLHYRRRIIPEVPKQPEIPRQPSPPRQPQPQRQPQRIRPSVVYDARRFDQESRLKARQHEGMSNSRIEGLERVEFFRYQEADPECAICMLQFQQGQEIIVLPCNHSFHPECLEPWLKTNATCPKCKQRIRQ